jgi:nicotinamidase-related amidase
MVPKLHHHAPQYCDQENSRLHMPIKNKDLHGNSPDTSRVVLLLIDVVNDLQFDGGDVLLPQAMEVARHLAALKSRAREHGIAVVYANDNFGRWRSDFKAVVHHSLAPDSPGRPVVEQLKPDDEDYFVLKPKHSAFYATTLETLLSYLGADTLIIGGLTGDICVLLTTSDAFMREFTLFVPSDCCASIDPEENRRALHYMGRVLHADTRRSAELDLAAMMAGTTGC